MKDYGNNAELKWEYLFPGYGLIEFFRLNKNNFNIETLPKKLINFSLICEYNFVAFTLVGNVLEKLLS